MLKWKLLLLSSVYRSPDDPVADADDPVLDDPADPADPAADADPDDPAADLDDPAATDDDDPESDDDPDASADEPAPRGDRSIGALRADRRRLAAENARLTREIEQSRRPVQQQVHEDPRILADRLALMSPEERIQHGVDQALARHAAQTQALNAQVMDQSDRVAFEGRQASDPLAKKLAPEVERRLAEVRQSGQNLPRQTVYTYLVGERVLAQQAKGKKPAAERVRRETVRPQSARGDVGNSRERRGGNTVADIESRYGDVAI